MDAKQELFSPLLLLLVCHWLSARDNTRVTFINQFYGKFLIGTILTNGLHFIPQTIDQDFGFDVGDKYFPTEDCFDFDSVFFPSFSEVGIVIYTTGGLGTGVCILVKLKPIKL